MNDSQNAVNVVDYGLRPLHRALVDLYEQFRVVCADNDITFYAAYGTALGAVRHKGFIPWDDDFDVEMLRDDYERFLRLAPEILPKGLRLVSAESTYGYHTPFAKIIVEDEERVKAVERELGRDLGQGLFIDVFCVDGLPDSKLGRFWYVLRRTVLKVKEHAIFADETRDVFHLVSCMIIRFLMRLVYPSVKTRLDFYRENEKIRREVPVTRSKRVHVYAWAKEAFDGARSNCCMEVASYGNPKWIPFEGTAIPVPCDVDKYLQYYFGNYMSLPPVDRRRASHVGSNGYKWRLRLGRLTLSQQPLLSIVVANYNYGRYLETALHSVVSQCWGTAWGQDGQNVLVLPSGESLELIICDGGSSDNSVDVIKRHAHELAWWCTERDDGQSDAFNKGFSHATGKYLTWLNADDLMVAGSLEKVARQMLKHPDCQWFTGNYFRFVPSGKIQQMNWGPNFYPKWLQWKCSPIVVFGPTSFFSKKIFEEAGGFLKELQNGMDNYLWIKFILSGVKQRRIRTIIWAFRLHEESKTSDFEGHVRSQAHLDDAKRDAVILNKMRDKKRLQFALFCVRVWRIVDGSFMYRAFLKLRYRYVNSLIKGVPGLVRKQFVVVHCMLTPYRNLMFSEMYKQLLANNVDFWVHYMTAGRATRPADWIRQHAAYPHKFWRNCGFGTHFLNVGLILYLFFHKPDWMLIGNPYDSFTGVLATIICRAKCKIVWCEGNTKNPGQLGGFLGRFKRWIYSHSNYAAVPGKEGVGHIRLHQQLTKRQMPKTVILPNLVDQSKFRPRVEWSPDVLNLVREKLGVSCVDRVCLIPARLVPVKGLIQLIEQLDAHMLDGWKVVVLGSGPLKDEIELKILSRGLCNWVHLVANIDYKDMPKAYAVADLFMLPSVKDMNPLTVVEALHAGLPVALSEQAGNAPEAVEEGVNGWGLPVLNAAAYKEKLKMVFATSIEDLRSMGRQSKLVKSRVWDVQESIRRFLSGVGVLGEDSDE